MKYNIAKASTISELVDQVNFWFLSEGWEVQGDVVFDGKQYLQAVVRKESK